MRFFPINRKFELQRAQNDLHRRNFLSQKKDVVLILGILLLSAVSALLISADTEQYRKCFANHNRPKNYMVNMTS